MTNFLTYSIAVATMVPVPVKRNENTCHRYRIHQGSKRKSRIKGHACDWCCGETKRQNIHNERNERDLEHERIRQEREDQKNSEQEELQGDIDAPENIEEEPLT